MLYKVLWPLAQEKEEEPNVNNSSNRRALLQEPLRGPEGIRPVCKNTHTHHTLALDTEKDK